MNFDKSLLVKKPSRKQDVSIDVLIEGVSTGRITLPEFQRDYVWTLEQVKNLVQSMVTGKVIGSVLLWETETTIPGKNLLGTEPKKDIFGSHSYLLDGQQRMTSIYNLIQGNTIKKQDFSKIVFDFDAESVDEFVQIESETLSQRCIPVKDIFEEDFYKVYNSLITPDEMETLISLKSKISTYPMVAYILTTDDVNEAVSQFNALNSGGKALTVPEIVYSRLYDKDFDYSTKLDILIEELKDFKIDKTVLVNSMAFWVKGDFLGKDLVAQTISEVKPKWSDFEKVVRRLVDYLKSINYPDFDSIPYKNVFTVLCKLFYEENIKHPNAIQNKNIIRYMLFCGLTRRYRVSSNKAAKADYSRLKNTFNLMNHDEFYLKVTNDFLLENGKDLAKRDAFLKQFGWLLLQENPRSLKNNTVLLTNGESYSKRYSKNLHHIFPTDYMKKQKKASKYPVNHIVNLCYTEAGVNQNEISNKAPSVYLTEFAKTNKQIKESCASCLIHYDLAIEDDYNKFFVHRLNAIRAVLEEYFPDPKPKPLRKR